MPYEARPTLAQIRARVKADVQGSLQSDAAFYRRSFERGVVNAVAGASHQQHAHHAWMERQLDPRTADADILESVHGEPFGIPRLGAIKTQLTISATGTNGTDVTAGTVYTRSDGTRYTVDATATVSGGTVSFQVTAEIAAAAANTGSGAEFEIESPIAGLSTTANVTATVTQGADREDVEVYRARVVEGRKTPARGGAKTDFVRWMREVAGITRGWEYPKREGAGTVTLFGVNDADDPITLAPSKIDEVAAYLDQPGRQPTIATVFVRTPLLQELNPQINLSPNTQAVRDAVAAELKDLLLRTAHPGGMTLPISQINEAISIAPGENDHVLVSPAADVVFPFGTLPIVGTPVWGSL